MNLLKIFSVLWPWFRLSPLFSLTVDLIFSLVSTFLECLDSFRFSIFFDWGIQISCLVIGAYDSVFHLFCCMSESCLKFWVEFLNFLFPVSHQFGFSLWLPFQLTCFEQISSVHFNVFILIGIINIFIHIIFKIVSYSW